MIYKKRPRNISTKFGGILRDLSKQVKNNRADLGQRFRVQVLKFTFERIQEKVLRPKRVPQFDESIPIEKELKEAVDSLKKGLQNDGVDRKPFTKKELWQALDGIYY